MLRTRGGDLNKETYIELIGLRTMRIKKKKWWRSTWDKKKRFSRCQWCPVVVVLGVLVVQIVSHSGIRGAGVGGAGGVLADIAIVVVVVRLLLLLLLPLWW